MGGETCTPGHGAITEHNTELRASVGQRRMVRCTAGHW